MTSTPLQEAETRKRAEENAVKEIIYATACRYEGHEPHCNIYGCKAHEHPEVKAVRQEVRRALQSAAHTARQNALEEAAKVADAQGWEDTAQAIRTLSTPSPAESGR